MVFVIKLNFQNFQKKVKESWGCLDYLPNIITIRIDIFQFHFSITNNFVFPYLVHLGYNVLQNESSPELSEDHHWNERHRQGQTRYTTVQHKETHVANSESSGRGGCCAFGRGFQLICQFHRVPEDINKAFICFGKIHKDEKIGWTEITWLSCAYAAGATPSVVGLDETGTEDDYHENVQGFLPNMHKTL
jgi:hypothetical protein